MADPTQLKDVLPNPPVAVPEPVKIAEVPTPPPTTVPETAVPVSPPPAASAPPTPAAPPPAAAAPPKTEAPPSSPPSWKIPEGFTMSDEVKSAIDASLKEGAKPEHLQRFLDLHVGTLQKAEANRRAAEQQRLEGWTNAVLRDPEIGGQRFEAAREAAASFINSFGDDDLKRYLSESGAGYHPGVFRAFARAGSFIRSRMTEDSLASITPRSGGASNRPATPQERLEKLYDSPDMQRLRKR